jgi:hypothetical protein
MTTKIKLSNILSIFANSLLFITLGYSIFAVVTTVERFGIFQFIGFVTFIIMAVKIGIYIFLKKNNSETAKPHKFINKIPHAIDVVILLYFLYMFYQVAL